MDEEFIRLNSRRVLDTQPSTFNRKGFFPNGENFFTQWQIIRTLICGQKEDFRWAWLLLLLLSPMKIRTNLSFTKTCLYYLKNLVWTEFIWAMLKSLTGFGELQGQVRIY